jgi:hypothetical protein
MQPDSGELGNGRDDAVQHPALLDDLTNAGLALQGRKRA